jgi:hypothetical protein
MDDNPYRRHYQLQTMPQYALQKTATYASAIDTWVPSEALLQRIGEAWLTEKPWKGPWEASYSADKLLE